MLQEVSLKAVELSADQVTGLVDQAEQGVGGSLGWGLADELCYIELVRSKAATHLKGLRGVLVPDGQVAVAEEVLIIAHEFFEAGAGNVGQLEFGFLGGAGGHTPLRDVACATAGGLYHLVVSARPFLNEAVAEDLGGIVDPLGRMEATQLLVAAMLGDKAVQVVGQVGLVRRVGRVGWAGGLQG
jgi:hypothetical protein